MPRFRKNNKGSISVVAAVVAPLLVGFVGLAVDLGYAYYCRGNLIASTDAAALAGAQNINVGIGGTAISMATSYSSAGSTDYNANQGMAVTMSSGFPVLKCLTSTGVSCVGADSANAIEVQQQAVVPTFFLRLFGINSFSMSAESLASSRGGAAQELDVEIVLDTTESMNNTDQNCIVQGLSSPTREDCAVYGVQVLLSSLSPCSSSMSNCGTVTNGNVANPLDRIGLMVFPGLTNSSQTQYEYDCKTSPAPGIAKYSASPVYQIVPFSSDFRSSDTATTLSTTSDLVLTARGVSTCNEGVDAVGGMGTFYADAITAAETALANNGRSTAQKVIILISDGAANASSSNMPAGEATNQCHEGITAAQTAAAAGTWVYSISYGSSTATNPSLCTTDTPVISSCSTMQQIASDSTKYYSDTSGGDSSCVSAAHPISQLSAIFKYIATDAASTARLVPLNTT
jgi:Flp pilus assembly protein TadG